MCWLGVIEERQATGVLEDFQFMSDRKMYDNTLSEGKINNFHQRLHQVLYLVYFRTAVKFTPAICRGPSFKAP